MARWLRFRGVKSKLTLLPVMMNAEVLMKGLQQAAVVA